MFNKEKYNQMTTENLQLKKEIERLQEEHKLSEQNNTSLSAKNSELNKSITNKDKLLKTKDLELLQVNNKYDTLAKIIEETLENQSATIEESSASIEEISASAETITEKLESSTNDTKKAHNITLDFQKKIHNLQSDIGVTLINSFNEINNIISIMNKISNQTNLIGLNASIEAARVGEQGKGFAVVADEIRKLANESKSNSEHIKDIINENAKVIETISGSISSIVKEINIMVKQNETRTETISQINESIKELSNAVNQSAIAVQQQAEEISNIKFKEDLK